MVEVKRPTSKMAKEENKFYFWLFYAVIGHYMCKAVALCVYMKWEDVNRFGWVEVVDLYYVFYYISIALRFNHYNATTWLLAHPQLQVLYLVPNIY